MAQTSRIQGKRCVAYGCSNTHKDEVSMHTFPSRDPEARKQWVDFVKKDRADWEPTRYSNLCSAHFTPECFPVKYRILELYGKAVRYKSLIKGSVPTIDAVFDTITMTWEELPSNRKISFKSITRQKKVKATRTIVGPQLSFEQRSIKALETDTITTASVGIQCDLGEI